MRKSRRLVVPLAVTALVAAGGVGLGLALVANAQTEITSCTSTGTPISCTISDANTGTTVSNPSSIQAVVTLESGDNASTPDQYVQITYQVYCTLGGDQATTQQPTDDNYAITTGTPVTDTLTLGYTDPDSCEVLSLEAILEASSNGTDFTQTTTGSFTMELEWTPAASASATASSSTSSVNVPLIKGYGSKCLDDKGNSSSDKTEVIIWSCNSGDSAQGWTYTNDELQHNGKCANDAGNGGSGTHVILWSCTGAANEKWFHSGSDGEFVLSLSSHGLLCLDDPGYSTANRTQLIVYSCHNGSNQHWS